MSKKTSAEHKSLVIKHILENLKQNQWSLDHENSVDIHDLFMTAFPEEDTDLLLRELDPTLYKSWAEELVRKLNWSEIQDLLFHDLKACHKQAIDKVLG